MNGKENIEQKEKLQETQLGGRVSLRDYFAGQALGAAWQGFDKGYYEGDNSSIAACAYQIADAMLAEREKGND